MFDISFTELMVIGVVALVVIGPERLPGVARTVGALLGRLQRYVADVKADVQREMRLEEMKKLQDEIESQARGIETQVRTEMQSVEQSVDKAIAPLAAVPEQLSSVRPLADLIEESERSAAEQPAALPDAPAASSSAAQASSDVTRENATGRPEDKA